MTTRYKHEHDFKKIGGPDSDYSKCYCGALRHDPDGDLLENPRDPTSWKRHSPWDWLLNLFFLGLTVFFMVWLAMGLIRSGYVPLIK